MKEFGIEYDFSSPGYECLLPCDFTPCAQYNATCLDLTVNGSIWDISLWSEYLEDEFMMEYDQDSHG